MPCTKCEEGKYKWGKTGECEYATKEACESANHKYSKMKPTPLGKKTYEEYEKELKEFNLSKVERVDLGDVDDLKKLVDNSKKILKEVTTLEKKIQSEQKTLYKAVDTYNKLAKNLDEFEKEKSPLQSKVRKLIDGIRKASKELGINANSIDGMQEAITVVDELSKRSRFGMEADLMFVG